MCHHLSLYYLRGRGSGTGWPWWGLGGQGKPLKLSYFEAYGASKPLKFAHYYLLLLFFSAKVGAKSIKDKRRKKRFPSRASNVANNQELTGGATLARSSSLDLKSKCSMLCPSNNLPCIRSQKFKKRHSGKVNHRGSLMF